MRAMRPVWLLSATQALCMSGSFLFVLLGGIIGSHLAPTPALATLPVSVLIAGLAASVVPAGVLIHRFGRRAVFVGSALQAAAGCVLAGYAISTGRFWLFCAPPSCSAPTMPSSCSTGSRRPSTWRPTRASRAIALRDVRRPGGGLARAGIRGAHGGPRAVRPVRGFVLRRHRALPGRGRASVAHRRTPAAASLVDPRRRGRCGEIAAQPVFRVAVLAALASYTVMSFIMTATPISMHVVDGHDAVATARVIQVHLLGMYLPSLASGWIIAKFGDRPVIVAGTLLMAACVAIARLRRSRASCTTAGRSACWGSAGTCCSSPRRPC